MPAPKKKPAPKRKTKAASEGIAPAVVVEDAAETKHAGGRPSKFKPEFIEQARKLCELGLTDEELAKFFDVHVATIYRWQATHPEFCEALKVGKAPADDRVERSLYHKAVGYTFDSEKIFNYQGQVVRAKSVEHVPPDTTAAIFWLCNRRKDEWRQKQEISGPDGAALFQPVINVTTTAKPSPA